MDQEMYSRREIAAIFRAVVAANADLSTRFSSTEAQLYRAGFAAAIRALAIGFSINSDIEAGLYRLDDPATQVEIDFWESPTPLLPDADAPPTIIGDP